MRGTLLGSLGIALCPPGGGDALQLELEATSGELVLHSLGELVNREMQDTADDVDATETSRSLLALERAGA